MLSLSTSSPSPSPSRLVVSILLLSLSLLFFCAPCLACTQSTTLPSSLSVSTLCTCPSSSSSSPAWTESITSSTSQINTCIHNCSSTFNTGTSCRARHTRPTVRLRKCCRTCFNTRYIGASNTCVQRKACDTKVTLQQIKYIRQLRIPTLTTKCTCDRSRALRTLFTNQANKRTRNCVRDCARPILLPANNGLQCPMSYVPIVKQCCEGRCAGVFNMTRLVVPALEEGNVELDVATCVPGRKDPSPSPSAVPAVGDVFERGLDAKFNARVLRRALRKVFREDIKEVSEENVVVNTDEDAVTLTDFKNDTSSTTTTSYTTSTTSSNSTTRIKMNQAWELVVVQRNIKCIGDICGAKVTVWSQKELRWYIINKAFEILTKRPTWDDVYTTNRASITIRKRSAKKYMVHVPFAAGYSNIF